MDIFGIIIGIILSLVGIAGAILPGLPWPQLWFLGLLVLQFTLGFPFSWRFVILWGIINVALMVVDYFLPILGTKKFWGTKRGNTWCILGIIIGIFLGPGGIIFGPFVGAVIGEYLHQQELGKACKAGLGAFLGFISGVVLKLVVCVVMFGYLIATSIQYFL